MLRSFKKSELVSCLMRHFEQACTTDEERGAWQKARDWLPDVLRTRSMAAESTPNHTEILQDA
jgi:hypothetical protein